MTKWQLVLTACALLLFVLAGIWRPTWPDRQAQLIAFGLAALTLVKLL